MINIIEAFFSYSQICRLYSSEQKISAWKLLGLNDRFALRRRVLGIKKKYPELIKEFKLINSKF